MREGLSAGIKSNISINYLHRAYLRIKPRLIKYNKIRIFILSFEN